MVKGVLDSTSTSSDFYTVFDNIVATNPQLNKNIEDVRRETNLFLVRVLRFYPIRDLAFVEELGSKKRYYCHLTHEMLSYEVSFNCMCDGSVENGDKLGTYVKPYNAIYGIVANVRFKGTTDEKCLLSCLNYGNNNELKSSVRNGEIRIVSGDSTISLTGERINLMTPQLFINGLPYDKPKLENYYDKTEIATIKSDTDAQIKELNDIISQLDIEALTSLINEIQETIENIKEEIEHLDLSEYVKDDELESALSTKSDKNHNHDDRYFTETEITNKLINKVDKENGKGLSTNDYTTIEKNKLANIEAEANKTIVDSSLSSSSTNPVQNKIITSALNNKAPFSHTQSTESIDASDDTYNIISAYLGSNPTQQDVNETIDYLLGVLQSIDAIRVVSTLPTASSSTIGALYIVSENNKVNVYYTIQNGSAYSWHKMDADILDELSISWSDIQNNPFGSASPSDYAPFSHTHETSLTTQSGSIGIRLGNNQVVDLGYWINQNLSPKTHSHNNITSDGKVTVTGTSGGNMVVTNSSNQIVVDTTINVIDELVQSLITYGSNL